MVLGARRSGTKPAIEVVAQSADGRDALAQVLDLQVVDGGLAPRELGRVPAKPPGAEPPGVRPNGRS